MWINIRTGYTFKQVYGHLNQIAEKCKKLCEEAKIKEPYGGIADMGNTFAHIPWRKACKQAGIKPIYGVQIPVVENLQKGERRYPYNWMTFIARTQGGLQEIYKLVDVSFQQFYYRQRVTYDQVNKSSLDVVLLGGVSPHLGLLDRKTWNELSPSTPLCQRDYINHDSTIACIDNFYPDAEDDIIYEPFADERLRERKTTPIHILNKAEWMAECNSEMPIHNLKNIASACNVELPHAPMVRYVGRDNIQDWCKKGAIEKGITTKPEYISRYKREIKLIKEKGYVDYFLVVADVIRYAKTKMAVGPARGSSAGSLVCYLMGITEVDPLEYGLVFERFIDINRDDLPDIDIDFQHDKRHLVVKYLMKKYGSDNVAQIGNINRLKAKSAINRFAIALGIPSDDVHELKDSIIERSAGDSRFDKCIEDTFNDTEIGKSFIEKHSNIEVVKYIENHPSHTGVHAAGILVCNEPITKYCGVNSRDKNRVGMLDKNDAEKINLLKIDALFLTTMTILAEVCDQINKPYDWLYDIPVDDKATFKVFNDHRFNGVFQFDGEMVRKLSIQMPIETIEDVAVLNALGRPGPLKSGSAQRYVHCRSGKREIKYDSDNPILIDILKPTFGFIVYQEQVMKIVKELGKLTWGETSIVRKLIAKSKGVEALDKLYSKFEKGCLENNLVEEEIITIWGSIKTMGEYSFNKSHAVSYGLISYLCAHMKAHYPFEFLVANLKHTDNDRSALKILRDAVENDGVTYEYFNFEHSDVDWSVKNEILYGGFMVLDSIGPVKAKKAIKLRDEEKPFPAGMKKIIRDKVSPFKYLYPAKELYGDYYTDPKSHSLNHSVAKIVDVKEDESYTVIGCMIKKNLRDANESCFVSKRDGKFLTGNTSWLNMTIEDDTGQIMCKIQVKDYERFGKQIAETGKEGKDWYMIHGNKINGWSLLFVKNIKKITRSI